MDLQSEKIELIRLLIETDSREVIDRVKSVFKDDGYDFYDDLPEHVKADIDEGLADIKNGDVYDHESVMQEFKVQYGIKD